MWREKYRLVGAVVVVVLQKVVELLAPRPVLVNDSNCSLEGHFGSLGSSVAPDSEEASVSSLGLHVASLTDLVAVSLQTMTEKI